MRKILVFFALAFLNTAFAQDFYMKCGGKEIPYENGNKDHFRMTANCPYKESDTNNIPKAILDSSRKYLIGRAGYDFYFKLKYYSCQTIHFTIRDKLKKKNPFAEEADRRVKYAIQYYFIVQDSMRYYLSLVFDKYGNLISNDFLPEKKTNPEFDKIIDVCKATHIAESDTFFQGETEGVSLQFLPPENIFIWVVIKPEIWNGRNVTYRQIVINAQNGKIIDYKKQYSFSVCSGAWF